MKYTHQNPNNPKGGRKLRREEQKVEKTHRKQKNKMLDINPNISIIILNVNYLNIPSKKAEIISLDLRGEMPNYTLCKHLREN